MDRPPTSVILPTVRETDVVDEVADQLSPDDELLVVCDSERDPVAGAGDSLPDGVRFLVAGEPEDCSGKANAIATAMEAARHDRLVWTDDDFHHPPAWLTDLQRDYERQGPTTEVPYFVGRDPLSTLMEPMYVMGATAGLTLVNKPWGGAVIFERDDLDEAAFLHDLRRTVSDDGLLGAYLDVTPVKRVRRVEIGGTVRESLERNSRFMQIVRYFSPYPNVTVPLSTLYVACCLLFPLPAAVASTLLMAGLYIYFGVRRWTVLLTYPALIAQFPLLLYGLSRSFVWGGRRYHWRGRFDVVVDG
ncbi:glycosyltransferase [Halohasta salina]|uniref:glycosyltransferase n=1 Tax=Halohasta salina TaxID=2961621 RepID=UPI0020A2D52B|nr:glycosyltransferase family 2 protein [Halohasta salina]